MKGFLAHCGDWCKRHARALQLLQWFVVLIYAILIIVPVAIDLPSDTARIWNHITVLAQFVFWGIWWPFVLISIVVFGRLWCGIFCPEGTLTEFASRRGLNRAIPKWIRWKGWPFVAFSCTTLYGQMISVYQYPQATLLILGGSTIAAMLVGFIYTREKRVWCRYLCPVNGVFALLAKLAPIHYQTDQAAWKNTRSTKTSIKSICPTLLPLHNLQNASQCHMCGRCSGTRHAINLQARTMNTEILNFSAKESDPWQSLLILYGLFGIAFGAFYWTLSPFFITVKQWTAELLINHDILWPFDTNIPWWLFTHYPAQNDVFSWLDGALVLAYIISIAITLGTVMALLLTSAIRLSGSWSSQRFHHLVLAFIPLAGCGIFLGLSLLTMTLLKIEGLAIHWWAIPLRWVLLSAATLWSFWLSWKIVGTYTQSIRRLFSMVPVSLALLLGYVSWSLVI